MERNLIKSALLFRSCALFKTLNDSQIFAVNIPDGSIGYCCCMGNGGEHYSLALYRGMEGFATYIRSTTFAPNNAFDQFEMMCNFHAINCDFENVTDSFIDKKTKAYIKKVAEEEGIKICRPKGWPEFYVMEGSSQHQGLQDNGEIKAMTLALQAGCEVARKIAGLDSRQIFALGFGDFYATLEGGKEIPMLSLLPDGTWSWAKTVTPPIPQTDFIEPEFEDTEIASKIKTMRHRGIFQCRIMHNPIPVGDEKSKYFPIQLLAVLKPQGVVPFVPEFVREEEDWEFDILDIFANKILASGICPSSIETDDDRTYALLTDFCEKTGILLHKTKRISYLDEFNEFIFSTFI